MEILKQELIFALVAVFLIAGVLSLLVSPASAANPITPQNCVTRAQGIIQRTNDDIMDLDPGGADPIPVVLTRTCFNPCTSNPNETVTRTFHLRTVTPTQGPVTNLQVAVTIDYSGGEIGYGDTLGGQLAFDCNDGSFSVVVGLPEDVDVCGTDLEKVLCTSN
jgi:hypothetical protein